MRYFKLAVLSLMLGCVLMLSNTTPTASAKEGVCWDCYSTVQYGQFCYPLASCGAFYGECNYDFDHATFGCLEPFLVSCCTE